jgi:hypothetical protein
LTISAGTVIEPSFGSIQTNAGPIEPVTATSDRISTSVGGVTGGVVHVNVIGVSATNGTGGHAPPAGAHAWTPVGSKACGMNITSSNVCAGISAEPVNSTSIVVFSARYIGASPAAGGGTKWTLTSAPG